MFALSVINHLKNCFLDEEAQDLVEYALVVALISFSAVAAMTNLATGIAAAFGHLADQFYTDF